MCEVKRIYPTVLLGLINYIEQNYEQLDEFICMFHFKDGTAQMCYDMYTYRGAIGSVEMMKENLLELSREGTFEQKTRT